MGVCLRIYDKIIRSLWVRIRGETNKGNIMEYTCSRLPDQEEGVDKPFFRQMEEASLVVVNHPDIA